MPTSNTAAARGPETPARLDLLFGTRAIAHFMTLSKGQTRRLIKHGAIPTFDLDGVECALRSSLISHFKQLEAAHGQRS